MATDFAHFFDLSLDLLATIDMEGRFRELNPAWVGTTGYSREELAGAALAELVHPDDRDYLAEIIARVTAGTPVSNQETRFLCKDGEQRWLSWTISPDAEDALLYAIARDVTGYHSA